VPQAVAATQETTESRQLPPLMMRAAIESSSVDAEQRTVKVQWTTGARVLRRGVMENKWGPFYEELSLARGHVRLERLNNGAPLLNSHQIFDLNAVLGVVVPGSARVVGKAGDATVKFSNRAEVEPFFRDVQEGIIQNVSVGYRVFKYEKVGYEGDGESAIPIYRAIDWEPFEISAVTAGFDDGAGFRSNDKQQTNDCLIISRALEETNMPQPIETQDNPTPATPAPANTPTPAPAPAPTPTPAPDTEAQTRMIAGETSRVLDIQTTVRTLGLDASEGDALIKNNTPIGEARKILLDKAAATSDTHRTDSHIRITEDDRDKWQRGATAWVLQKAGVAPLIQRHMKLRGETVNAGDFDPGQFRGMSMLDLARESLERQGVKTRGMDKQRLVGEALTFRGGNYQTTSDFGVLLESVMNKTLLGAYATTPDTWQRFCAVGSVSDFRANSRLRMSSFGRLDRVAEDGEFKNKSIPDGEKEIIQAATFGNIIGISRQAIINDDLSAFDRLATMLGRAAKLSVEVDVYAELKLNSGLGRAMNDGKTLFHADHGNIATTAAAPTVTSIDAARVQMASQMDPGGNEVLDLRPGVWVGPIGLGSLMRTLNDAQYDPSVSNKFQVPNSVRGLYKDIIDTPRLTGTRWYSFADPAVAPAIEVVFLEGQTEPYMESKDGWRVDGVEWKVRHDYGVAPVDYRPAVTNAGA